MFFSSFVEGGVMYIEIRMREGVAECDLIRTLQPHVSKEIIHRNTVVPILRPLETLKPAIELVPVLFSL